MTLRPCFEPRCKTGSGTVALVIEPRSRDLGGFSVRRVLPAAERRMVGPFIFFDEMGPAAFPAGHGMDVRPHPHIGIATITYLFEGEIMHRDSLGIEQEIEPGAVNLMTAGRGIVHSERTGRSRNVDSTLHGIQSWIALPDGSEEIAPAFHHFAADALPLIESDRVQLRLIMGEVFGERSPVRTYSPTLYAELRMPAATSFALPNDASERALFIVDGAIEIDGRPHHAGVMVVFHAGSSAELVARQRSRLMLIGGEPVGARTIWWNFVSSSKARIEQAKADWRTGRFDRIAGDDEFIPLPED